ncbi:MAG: hypothetical protein ABII02_00085 [Candidatus Magasanikbacteria bacterium]
MKHIELFEFFAQGKNQTESHVLLHITEPSSAKEMQKGYFFALIEVSGGSPDQIEKIQGIIDTLEEEYYDTNDEQDPKKIFETALEYLNRQSKHILTKDTEVHSMVGILLGQELSFSYHGKPHAILLFNRGKGLDVMNIIDEEDTDETSLFPAVLEGTLSEGDCFVAMTPHVDEYFSYDRIQKILSSRNTRQAAAHIQKVLEDVKGKNSFGGLLFRLTPKHEIPRTGPVPKNKKSGSAESLHRLMESERETAETLSPPIFGNLARKVTKDMEEKRERKHRKDTPVSSKAETNYRPRSVHKDQRGVSTSVLIHLGRALVYAGSWLLKTSKRFLLFFTRAFVIILILITNKNNGRTQVLNSLNRKLSDSAEYIRNLPLLSKLLFLATIVCAVIFLGSITYVRVNEHAEAEQQTFENTLLAVSDKTSAAEAALIYNDEEKAFTLLQEATELLGTIGEKQITNEKRSELQNQIETIMMELRKINDVELTALASLDSLSLSFPPTHLAIIGNTLLAYNPEGNTYAAVNKLTGNKEVKDTGGLTGLKNNTTPKEQDTILFLTGNESVASYDKETGAMSAKEIAFQSEHVSLSDILIYNVRLYTLDPENNQIYKHNRTQTGYAKGLPWIKEEADLKGAVSLAVDGDIYVLKKNEILKFEGGKQKEFSVKNLEPALSSASLIWTYTDVPELFILEPETKRIVIMTKDGKVVRQVTSSSWNKPTGLVVDYTQNKMYVLDGYNVFALNITE